MIVFHAIAEVIDRKQYAEDNNENSKANKAQQSPFAEEALFLLGDRHGLVGIVLHKSQTHFSCQRNEVRSQLAKIPIYTTQEE
jgi:hypothetical protein